MDQKQGVIRILVADDSELMRSAVCSILQSHSGWCVCGEATDGTDAIEKAIDLKPDVIIMDLSMPRHSGLEVAEQVHGKMPRTKILIVSEHDSRTLAHIESHPGVTGCVMKSRLSCDLIPAVEATSRDPMHFSSASPR